MRLGDTIAKDAKYAIIGVAAGLAIILGPNSMSNQGKYIAQGEFKRDYRTTREEIILKNTTNRFFGADYIEKRKEDGLKIKYFQNKKGHLKKIKYNGDNYSIKYNSPRSESILKEGQERLNGIKRYINWKEEKKVKKRAEELKEPIYREGVNFMDKDN